MAKKWQQKSLKVKVLFTIRRLQPEYEMQRDHACPYSHAIYGASPEAEALNKKNPQTLISTGFVQLPE